MCIVENFDVKTVGEEVKKKDTRYMEKTNKTLLRSLTQNTQSQTHHVQLCIFFFFSAATISLQKPKLKSRGGGKMSGLAIDLSLLLADRNDRI